MRSRRCCYGNSGEQGLRSCKLEWRSEGDDSRRIQMRPRSLPVDPVSYPITTAARGRGGEWGMYREYGRRKRSVQGSA